MLSVQNMEVYYGAIHAIKNISFTVNDGEIVSLIGSNGAGKTTILRTLSGLEPLAKGSMTYDGINLARVAPHKIPSLGIAHVPEGRHIFLRMTVLENLRIGGSSMSGDQQQDALEEVFRRFPRLKGV